MISKVRIQLSLSAGFLCNHRGVSRASWALAVALAVTAWPDHDVTTWPGPAVLLFDETRSRDYSPPTPRATRRLSTARSVETSITWTSSGIRSLAGEWHDWQFVQAGLSSKSFAVVERDMASMPDVVSRARRSSRSHGSDRRERDATRSSCCASCDAGAAPGREAVRLADEHVQANVTRGIGAGRGRAPTSDRSASRARARHHHRAATTPDSLAAPRRAGCHSRSIRAMPKAARRQDAA